MCHAYALTVKLFFRIDISLRTESEIGKLRLNDDGDGSGIIVFMDLLLNFCKRVGFFGGLLSGFLGDGLCIGLQYLSTEHFKIAFTMSVG